MKVPRSTAQQGINLAGGPRANLNNPVSSAIESAGRDLGEVGKVLEARTLQRQKEIDTAAVLDQFSSFSDESRETLGNILNRKGADAYGSGKDYITWMNERLPDYEQKLENEAQRNRFKSLVINHRAGRLDTLARHEAAQHQAHKISTQQAMFNNIQQEATLDPYNVKMVDDSIDRFHASSIDLMGGQYARDTADEAEAQIRKIQLLAMIDQDPEKAKPYLEEWKEDIGIETYIRYKAKIDSAAREGQTTGQYLRLKSMFPNPEQAIEYLYDEKNLKTDGIDIDMQGKLLSRFHAEEAREDEIEREKKEAGRKAAFDSVAAMLRDKNKQGALSVLDKSEDLSEVEKLKLEQQINEPEKNVTDPMVRDSIIRMIENGTITHDSQIMIYTGHGIVENDEQFLRQFLKDFTKDPDQKFFTDMAADYYKGEFKGTDFEIYLPEFKVAMHKAIKDQKLKGDAIFEWAKTYVGKKKDIIDPWFWQESGTEGDVLQSQFGRDIQKKSETIKEPKTSENPTKKTFKIGSEGEAIANEYQGIPDEIKNRLITELKNAGLPTTEANVLHVYKTNYGKATK